MKLILAQQVIAKQKVSVENRKENKEKRWSLLGIFKKEFLGELLRSSMFVGYRNTNFTLIQSFKFITSGKICGQSNEFNKNRFIYGQF